MNRVGRASKWIGQVDRERSLTPVSAEVAESPLGGGGEG